LPSGRYGSGGYTDSGSARDGRTGPGR
jgi:hypothetical protein